MPLHDQVLPVMEPYGVSLIIVRLSLLPKNFTGPRGFHAAVDPVKCPPLRSFSAKSQLKL
eukprot:CAMPEP_0172793330 /NCGR_PEP_ID=MMETSP1074-20121228/209425_1 /TAXON_ID=2916 /ORGANISM="Ceratium fusus, Strain PA161109" /LENGTH=59 /DNA_ID=CAMNT_0013630405 /DNA_START=677 /DNA_END=856 /DNA_ORIENTATION=+